MIRRGHQRGTVRSGGALLALTLLLVLYPRGASAATEYEVKAAFLYNFAKFVEWPPQVFASPGAPIQICVLGTNPFGSFLSDFTRGKQVNGRPISVRTEVPLSAAAGCQIVFVPSSENPRVDAILARLAQKPVLTVGDSADFAMRGGMIGLSMEANHVRFQVNMVAARAANLKLSSQLLKVATQIYGQLDEGR